MLHSVTKHKTKSKKHVGATTTNEQNHRLRMDNSRGQIHTCLDIFYGKNLLLLKRKHC